eukprot:gene48899-66375_t
MPGVFAEITDEKKAIAANNAVRDALSNWEGGRDFQSADIYTIAKRSNAYFTGDAGNLFAKFDVLMLAVLIIPLLLEVAIRLAREAGSDHGHTGGFRLNCSIRSNSALRYRTVET